MLQNGSQRGQVARVVHGSLMLGVILFASVVLFLKMGLGFAGLDTGTSRVLVIVGYVLLALAFVVTKVLRDRIEPPGRDTDLEEWWPSQVPKAVALWAVAEGTALAGVLFYLLTGNLPILILLAGFGLLILFVTRPARLEGHRPGAGRDVRGFGPRDDRG